MFVLVFSKVLSNSRLLVKRKLAELLNYTRLRGSLIGFWKLVQLMFKIPRV